MNEAYEASAIGPGAATLLENWVPEPHGGLRCRVGWTNTSTTGAPAAPRQCKGLAWNAKDSFAYACHPTSSTVYRFYKLAFPFTGNWVDTTVTHTAIAGTSPHVSSCVGLGYVWFSNANFSALQGLNNATATTVGAGKAGRAIAFHKNRLFSGGSDTTPYRVYYSDLGDATTWAADSYIDVGVDDGEPIRAMASYDNGLLIGKDNSLYFLTGSGPDSFQLHQLDAGACAPGSTIIPTPYGAIICGKETVWLWEGSAPIPISRAIENSYVFGVNFITGAYIDGTVYIADDASGSTFAYSFETRAWHIEKGLGVNESPVIYATAGQYLLGGSNNSTTASLAQYRQMPNTARARDSAHAETFRVNTPEIWLGTAAAPVTVRHVYLQVRQRGGDAADTGLSVIPYRDGTAGTTQTITPKASAQVFRHRLDFGGDAYSVQLRISQVCSTTDAALMDIESVIIEFDIENER